MVARGDLAAEWAGQELFDVTGQRIGSITGPGFPRRRFGASWLAVETAIGKTVLVPGDQVDASRGRLVLPYPKGYIESGPVREQDRPLSHADERRLCLQYGLESGQPNTGCRQGCGLCMAKRRADRARNRQGG